MKLTSQQLDALLNVDANVQALNMALESARIKGIQINLSAADSVTVVERYVRQCITPADIAESIILHSEEEDLTPSLRQKEPDVPGSFYRNSKAEAASVPGTIEPQPNPSIPDDGPELTVGNTSEAAKAYVERNRRR